MISKRFIKSSLIYTVVGALPLASSFILLPFYTIYLTTSTFGQFSLYLAFMLLVQVLVSFGMDTTIAIHYYDYKNNRKELSEYIGTALFIISGAGLIFICLFALFGTAIMQFSFQDNTMSFYPFGLMAVAIGIGNSIFKIYTTILIHKQETVKFFVLNILYFITTVTLSISGLYLYPDTLIGPIGSRFAAVILMTILILFIFLQEFGLHYKKNIAKQLLLFGAPILFFAVLTWVVSYADRYIINYFMHSSDVGIYDFAVKCIVLIEFFANGLETSINPRIFSIWSDQKNNQSTPEVNRYLNSYMAMLIFTIAVNIFIIPLIIPVLIADNSYLNALAYVPLLAITFVFRGWYNLFITPVYFYKKTHLLPKILMVSSGFHLGISLFLIKNFGLEGAIYATLLSKPFQVLLLWNESRKFFNFNFNRIKIIFLPIIYLIMVLTSELLLDNLNRNLLYTLQLLLTVALLFTIYNKELLKLLKEKRTQFFNSKKQ